MALTDFGLVLELIPEGVGSGAAMAITAPTTTIGFVIGSVIFSMSLWLFPLPPGTPAAGTAEKPLAAVPFGKSASFTQIDVFSHGRGPSSSGPADIGVFYALIVLIIDLFITGIA